MRRMATIALAMSVAACGPQMTQDEPTIITPTTSTTVAVTSTTVAGPDSGWVRQEFPVPDGVDAFAAAWGDPGMVVLGYRTFRPDDSPTPNGIWFFDGSRWAETLIRDVTVGDAYGFLPEVTDIVWFGGRFLAFLMGDSTTSPGRASMLVSDDGIHWDLEYLGGAPTAAALPAGLFATPESPPWPGTSAVARATVSDEELIAVGWTRLGEDESFASAPVVWRSSDGRAWTTTVLANANYDNEWAADVAAGPLGYLVQVAGPIHQSAWLWYSPDGDAWTYVGDRFGDEQLLSIAVSDAAMLALMLGVEDQSLSLWQSSDGLAWQEVDRPFDDPQLVDGWYEAAVDADCRGLLAIAGARGGVDLWRSFDGLVWTELPPLEASGGGSLVRPLAPRLRVVRGADLPTLVVPLSDRVIRWTEANAPTP